MSAGLRSSNPFPDPGDAAEERRVRWIQASPPLLACLLLIASHPGWAQQPTEATPAAAGRLPAAAGRLPAAAGRLPAAAGRLNIASVSIHLPLGYDPKDFSNLIAVHAGEPVSRDAIRDSIERLYATGQFSDVVVRWERMGDGVSISFEIAAQKQLAEIELLGNQALSHTDLTEAAIAALDEKQISASLPVPVDRASPELMRQGMEKAYADRGYQSAHVEPHPLEALGPVDVKISFHIDEGPPTRVAGLSTSGDPKLAPEALGDAAGIDLGDILDKANLTEASKRLRKAYQATQRYRAQVGAPRTSMLAGTEDQALVTIPVSAGPRIRFGFRGNASFSSHDLWEKLAFSPDDVLDVSEESDMAGRLTTFYHLAGFYDARVNAQEIWSPDRDQLAVVFVVDEGQPLIVRSIQFVGAHHFSAEKLIEQITSAVASAQGKLEAESSGDFAAQRPVDLAEVDAVISAGPPPPSAGQYPIDPAKVFDEKEYRAGIAQIVEMYHAEGFLEATASLPILDIDEVHRMAQVSITVSEGIQTFVGELKVVSAEDPFLAIYPEVIGKVTLHEGKPYSVYEEEVSRQALLAAVQNLGHLWAQVTTPDKLEVIADPSAPPGTQRVRVVFTLLPGPIASVNSIIVKGNAHTQDRIIREELTLEPGDVFSPEKVAQSEKNLNRLAVFQRIQMGPLDPDHVDPKKDLEVDLEERSRWVFEPTAGLSVLDGPRVGLTATWSNVANRGLTLTADAKINYYNWSWPVLLAPPGPDQLQPEHDATDLFGFGGHADVGLRDPRLGLDVFNDLLGTSWKPEDLSGHLDLVIEHIDRPAYDFSRGAMIAGTDWRLTRWLTASLSDTVEWDDITKPKGLDEIISELSASDLVQYQFPAQPVYLNTLAPTVTIDLRDNAANPRAGLLLHVTAELVKNIGNEIVSSYIKPSGTASFYIPIPLDKMVFVTSVGGGRIFPFRPDSQTIVPKRFFMGGETTMRGYGQDAMIPEDERKELDAEATSCNALITQSGCTVAANVLKQGYQVPSEGGEAYILYRGELRVPITDAVQLAAFVDVGDLWLDPALASLLPQRVNPGLGILYLTPIGPVVLDFGSNPRYDQILNESFFSATSIQFAFEASF